MSSALPWFRFFPSQFFADIVGMNKDEVGAYVVGISRAWVNCDSDQMPPWMADQFSSRMAAKEAQSEGRRAAWEAKRDSQLLVNYKSTTSEHIVPSLLSSSLPLNTEVVNTNTTTLKDSSTLSRERTPLSPVGEKEEEPRPVPAWVQEHNALERGENLKAEIDRLISARGIYGTRMTVTQALGVAKARQGYDESVALALLPTRAVYERKRGMKTPMKLETLLETGGWAVDWEERLGQEMPEVDEDGFTREEIDNAY